MDHREQTKNRPGGRKQPEAGWGRRAEVNTYTDVQEGVAVVVVVVVKRKTINIKQINY